MFRVGDLNASDRQKWKRVILWVRALYILSALLLGAGWFILFRDVGPAGCLKNAASLMDFLTEGSPGVKELFSRLVPPVWGITNFGFLVAGYRELWDRRHILVCSWSFLAPFLIIANIAGFIARVTYASRLCLACLILSMIALSAVNFIVWHRAKNIRTGNYR
ncbi:MAG: hypothetical protein FWC27_09565 [Firmicutes bacterium]|nr:hypothetical protein [Bacillota bacterium]